MQVLALRHGQSEYNLLGLCNDDPRRAVGLTELGRRQARRAGEQLGGRAVERLFCSQLPRAMQTAELINRRLRVPLSVTAELNDIRSGFDGRPVAEYLAAIAADPLHTVVNDGESLARFRTRIERFLGGLARRAERCVAVVTHEEALRVFKGWSEGLSAEQTLGLAFDNCEIYSLDL